MKTILILPFVLLASIAMRAQTFTGNGGPIPTDIPAYYSINVESLGTAKLDTSFGVVKVGINVRHVGDIEVEAALIAPDGTQVILTAGNGYSGDNYTNTFFDDKAKVYITAGTAPFNGTFRPNETLGSVNNGQPANGVWKLLVIDNWPEYDNPGTLVNWSITFGNNATGPDTTFTSSNLPIVILNTNGQVILNEPKIPAGLKIIDNGPGKRNYITDTPQFEGYSGVERRGYTAQLNAKKSYGLETWDALGNDIDTTLLGMPTENDWILNAGFTDKTLIRNALAYQVWQNLGHYATRYQFVELVINGQYKGVYTFSEKIKRDKDRVNIAKLNPDENAGDNLTGGYIIKIDKTNISEDIGWTSSYLPPSHSYGQTIFFEYEYPNEKVITPEQKAYIKNYVNDFETALDGANFTDTVIGFRKYAIESTFIDYFLVNEISKNVDAYRASVFIQKQRDSKGGKLRMGPAWDYDLAWHNANSCNADLYTGWAYKFPCTDDTYQVPFWWDRLLKDTLFTSNLKCRWHTLRQNKNILSDAWFDNYIDSLALQLDESQQRNYKTWDVLGVWLWFNPYPIPSTYQGEINSLKNWIHNRLTWLDKNMPGKCSVTGINDVYENVTNIVIYPNPFSSVTTISWQMGKTSRVTLKVLDIVGRTVATLVDEQRPQGKYETRFNAGTLPKGIYFCQLKAGEFTQTRKMILLE